MSVGCDKAGSPRILIVDDDESVRDVVADYLRHEYEVVTARDGHEGLSEVMVGEHRANLIITDLNMPGLDGIELVDSLPESIPVIVISGFLDTPKFRRDIKRVQATAVFSKPFALAELERAVREALEGSCRRREQPRHPGRSLEASTGPSGATTRILIVDDFAPSRELLRAILEDDAREVIDATDGEEALRLFDQHNPDLTVIDFILPKLSGPEVIAEIRGKKADANIVALGSVDLEVLRQAEQAGADLVIQKPFDIREFLASVDRILQEKR